MIPRLISICLSIIHHPYQFFENSSMPMGGGDGVFYLLLLFCQYITKRVYGAPTIEPPTPKMFCVIYFMIFQSIISKKPNLINDFSPYRVHPKFTLIYVALARAWYYIKLSNARAARIFEQFQKKLAHDFLVPIETLCRTPIKF